MNIGLGELFIISLICLTPIAIGMLVTLAGVWLRTLQKQRAQGANERPCPTCGRLTQVDWKTCPYCSQPLV